MAQILLLVLACLLFCRSALASELEMNAAIESALAQQLQLSDEWQSLVLYKQNMWGNTRSQIESDHSFLSSSGRHDPKAELLANIRAMYMPVSDGQATITMLVAGSWLDMSI